MYPLEAIRYWWQRYLSFFIFLIVFDILLDFCAVTNQGGWTKEVRTNWSWKKWCWYRPGTDHAILRLRGTTEVQTPICPGRAETRYYSYLKDCLWNHLSVSGRIWSVWDELGLAGTNRRCFCWYDADLEMIWLEPAAARGHNTASFSLVSAKDCWWILTGLLPTCNRQFG
jgi:hypothetical protein